MVLTREDLEREHKEHKEYLRDQAVENELEKMASREPTMIGLAVIGIAIGLTALIVVGGAILGKYIKKIVYETNVNQERYQTQGERN